MRIWITLLALAACDGSDKTPAETGVPTDDSAANDSHGDDSQADDTHADDSGDSGDTSVDDTSDSGDDTGIDSGPYDGDGDGSPRLDDCDDDDDTVYPGADELCDGIDNDCDEEIDEDAVDMPTWYTDADEDSYGDPDTETTACEAPEGGVSEAGDCDDTDPSYNPDADESDCTDPEDYNCDGLVDYADEDADGWAACLDCDDEDADINPDASEICDELDNDCDTLYDDEDDSLDSSTGSTWYDDADLDGYGDPDVSVQACLAPDGTTDDDTDCDDDDDAVYPGAADICDGKDNNCEGSTDEEALDGKTLYSAEMSATTGYVYSLDDATAASATVSSLSWPSTLGLNSMTISEAGDAYVSDYANESLFKIDICTGTLTLVGVTGAGNLCGIGFGPGGKLYGVDSTNDQLVELDPSTGVATVIGDLGVDLGACGMAYDCAHDQLIAVDSTGDTLDYVDATTGEVTDSVALDFSMVSVGAAYNPVNQTILISTSTKLYEADMTTGASTVIGTIGWKGAQDDLEYFPECP